MIALRIDVLESIDDAFRKRCEEMRKGKRSRTERADANLNDATKRNGAAEGKTQIVGGRENGASTI